MCILAVASGCHDDYPLVCIHNREEERDRPTTPCELRPSGVICALDELKGGTWMGLNRSSGLFSSLTNLRATNPPRGAPASRGLLVSELLESEPESELAVGLREASAASLRRCERVLRRRTAAREYEGLNLCVGGWHPTPAGAPPAVFRGANVPPQFSASASQRQATAAADGWSVWLEAVAAGEAHAWSNNDPATDWPKSTWLRQALSDVLATTPEAKADPDARARAAGAVAACAAVPIVEERFPGCAECPLPPRTAALLRELCGLLCTTHPYTEPELPQDMAAFSPLPVSDGTSSPGCRRRLAGVVQWPSLSPQV